MKNLVFILLVFPILVFAQQRKGTSTMKIKKKTKCPCLTIFNGHYDGDSLSLAEFNANSKIDLLGDCGDSAKIVSFVLAMAVSNRFVEMATTGDHFSKNMLDSISKISTKAFLIIKSIQCIANGGQLFYVPGMAFYIDSLRKPQLNMNQCTSCILATINGLWGDQTLKSDDIISAGKLTLTGDYPDSSKITSFQMAIAISGQFITFTSFSEYFTKEMLDNLKKAPRGTFIIIQHINCYLPTIGTRSLRGLTIKTL